MINNNYQKDSKFLQIFVLNWLFVQLLDIFPKSLIFIKAFNSRILFIDVRSTDQNSTRLETEDRINITLVIN